MYNLGLAQSLILTWIKKGRNEQSAKAVAEIDWFLLTALDLCFIVYILTP